MGLRQLRAMQPSDIAEVVALIDSHDEDDAEAAEAGFSQTNGLEDYFVLEIGGAVIGVCGFRTPPGCNRTHWLSWTYVHADHVGQGHGRCMLEELLDHLRSQQARKVFIKISDYTETDEQGNLYAPYAAALHLYQSLGFVIELTHRHYYDISEALIILGRRLDRQDGQAADANDTASRADSVRGGSDAGSQQDADFAELPSSPSSASRIDLASLAEGPLLLTRPVRFNAVYEIAETTGAWSFGWHDQGKSLFTTKDVEIGLEEVRQQQGRAVFLSFPSDYKDIDERLYAAGFHNAGGLDDYFEDGVHEQHYSYYFRQELQLKHD